MLVFGFKKSESDIKLPLLFFSYRFTQIAVDPQIKTPGGKSYDVLFIGTGKSFAKLFSSNKSKYVHVKDLQS